MAPQKMHIGRRGAVYYPLWLSFVRFPAPANWLSSGQIMQTPPTCSVHMCGLANREFRPGSALPNHCLLDSTLGFGHGKKQFGLNGQGSKAHPSPFDFSFGYLGKDSWLLVEAPVLVRPASCEAVGYNKIDTSAGNASVAMKQNARPLLWVPGSKNALLFVCFFSPVFLAGAQE